MSPSDPRHAQVRIRGRVAVARKVFRGRQHAAFVRALDVGRHQLPHLLRIFAKRTRVDDRVHRIGIDVGHRERNSSECRWPAPPAAVIRPKVSAYSSFSGRAEGHGVRKNGRAIQPHAEATLEIGGEQ